MWKDEGEQSGQQMQRRPGRALERRLCAVNMVKSGPQSRLDSRLSTARSAAKAPAVRVARARAAVLCAPCPVLPMPWSMADGFG